ncbi:MAG: hypothetical protein M3463_22715, partial [Verrucomicrobiota bacterium]|nr:hypothetical protein [Verrucomicrobiota bacterium]
EFYRFALLLTGRIQNAEQVMAETLAEVEAQLGELRNQTNRQAWLALRIRERSLRNNAEQPRPEAPRLLRETPAAGGKFEVLDIEAYILAQHFYCLPEPERSALALFYLDLFSIEEIARLLEVGVDELSQTLARARILLQDSLQRGQEASSSNL